MRDDEDKQNRRKEAGLVEKHSAVARYWQSLKISDGSPSMVVL